MNTVNCSCGCCKEHCKFDPCAVTCEKPSKRTSEYAYVFNVEAGDIDAGETIVFSDNGEISDGISHTEGSDKIKVKSSGVYMLNYYVGSNDDNQFTVFVNGEPVDGSTYNTRAGINYGQVIINIARGDVLTLVNTGDNDVSLEQEEVIFDEADTQYVVNASITLFKLF